MPLLQDLAAILSSVLSPPAPAPPPPVRQDAVGGVPFTDNPTSPARPSGWAGGWSNALTGMGHAQTDPSLSTVVSPPRAITEAEATALYRMGLSRRIVQLPAQEALRQGYTVTLDSKPVEALTEWAQDLPTHKGGARGLNGGLCRWLEWAGVYGGAVIVLLCSDGADPSTPLNEQAPRLKEIRVLSRYEISPPYTDGGLWHLNTGAAWHPSRLIPLGRSVLPESQTGATQGWDDSVYTIVWREIMAVGTINGAALQATIQYSTPWQRISGLTRALSRGGNELLERMGLQQMMTSMYRLRVIGDGEEVGITTQSVAGLAELMRQFPQSVCAAIGLPYSLLMGKEAGGLSTADDSGERFFYDSIKAREQEQILAPALRRIFGLAAADLGLPAPQIQFRPLYQLTELEMEELASKKAARDETYIANGVLTPEEVRAARFGGDAGDVRLLTAPSPPPSVPQ